MDGIAFSPDGTLLVAATWENTVLIWNPSTGTQLSCLTGHSDWVEAVVFSPDGSLLASSSDDHTVRIWGLPT
jgi:WD40 repeat protein